MLLSSFDVFVVKIGVGLDLGKQPACLLYFL